MPLFFPQSFFDLDLTDIFKWAETAVYSILASGINSICFLHFRANLQADKVVLFKTKIRLELWGKALIYMNVIIIVMN